MEEQWITVASRKSSRRHNRAPKDSKPPVYPGSGLANIPQWERKFLTSIYPSWLKRLKSFACSMNMYPEIHQWDDSGAVENFENAKSHFWAKINNLPCNLPLPDPDMYIDEVDHDEVIDPELVAELDIEPPEIYSTDGFEEYDTLPLILYDGPFLPTGWDGNDLAIPQANDLTWPPGWDIPFESIKPTGWGDADDPVPGNDLAAKPQQASLDIPSEEIKPTGWVNAEDPLPANDPAFKPGWWDAYFETNKPTGWISAEDPVPANVTASKPDWWDASFEAIKPTGLPEDPIPSGNMADPNYSGKKPNASYKRRSRRSRNKKEEKHVGYGSEHVNLGVQVDVSASKPDWWDASFEAIKPTGWPEDPIPSGNMAEPNYSGKKPNASYKRRPHRRHNKKEKHVGYGSEHVNLGFPGDVSACK